MHTGLISLWNVHLWVAKSPSSLRSSVLQDLGYDVLSLHVIVQENMCHVALDQSEVQEGTSPKKVTSLYVLVPRV